MTIFLVSTENSLLFRGFLDAFSSTLQTINSCFPWRFNISLHENIYRGDLPTRRNGQFLLYLQHLKSTRFQRFVVKQLSLKTGPGFFFCSHVFSRTYIAKMGRQIVSCQPAISIFLYLRRSMPLKSIGSCLRNFFLNVILRRKRFRSSRVMACFRFLPTFASNSRGNGCYAGYLNVAQLYHQWSHVSYIILLYHWFSLDLQAPTPAIYLLADLVPYFLATVLAGNLLCRPVKRKY